jgi:hypothetical protein
MRVPIFSPWTRQFHLSLSLLRFAEGKPHQATRATHEQASKRELKQSSGNLYLGQEGVNRLGFPDSVENSLEKRFKSVK